MNPKMPLTVCGEKRTCTSVIFPKGSLKKEQIYETSIELSKKFNTIFKIRLEIEEAGEGETWHCCEVKLQDREIRSVLEFPFCHNFADEEGGRVTELPLLTAGSPFQQVDIFEVEAVDIGILQRMVVEKGRGSDWLLENIIVKESSSSGTETLFIAQTRIEDRRDGKRSASITPNATEVQERRTTSAWPLGREQMNSEGRWRIYFTKHQEETKSEFEKLSENISKMVMVFYGSNSKSNPVSMENKVEHQTENQITYDIHLPSDLGVLYKVRLGLQSLENNISQLSLRHFKIQNTSTLDTFSLTLNKTLPLSPNGDRWIEFPIQWPLKEALSVIVDAVDLGQLEKIVLLTINKTDCKLEVKKLHVQEAAKEHPTYVFEVNEEFSVSANKPEIQREIPGSFVIRGEKQMNDIDSNLNKEGSQVKNLTEYTIKVSTGDKRGAGTDANVYILFGNEDKSEVFQLSQSLEHQNPFGRGKVDTFKIKTKKLSSLCSVEIGHDGKGLASAWFLEKSGNHRCS